MRFLPEVRPKPERPVSRVLSPRWVAPAREKVIPLGRPLLDGSSTLTRTPHLCRNRGDWADRPRRCPYSSLLREGLAPPPVTRLSRVGSYPTISPLPVRQAPKGLPSIGGVVSAALSLEFPRVGVTDLPVLWSPDFPPVKRPLFRRPNFTGDLPAAFGGPAHSTASWLRGNGAITNDRQGRNDFPFLMATYLSIY